MSRLDELDRIAAELRQRNPGWQVWFVPRTGQAALWCARPWPLLNAQSPEHLEAEIAPGRVPRPRRTGQR